MLGAISTGLVDPGETVDIVSRAQCIFRPDRLYVPTACATFMVVEASGRGFVHGGSTLYLAEVSARELAGGSDTRMIDLALEGSTRSGDDMNAGVRDLGVLVPEIGAKLTAARRVVTPDGAIATTVRNDGPVAAPFVGAYLGYSIE